MYCNCKTSNKAGRKEPKSTTGRQAVQCKVQFYLVRQVRGKTRKSVQKSKQIRWGTGKDKVWEIRQDQTLSRTEHMMKYTKNWQGLWQYFKVASTVFLDILFGPVGGQQNKLKTKMVLVNIFANLTLAFMFIFLYVFLFSLLLAISVSTNSYLLIFLLHAPICSPYLLTLLFDSGQVAHNMFNRAFSL